MKFEPPVQPFPTNLRLSLINCVFSADLHHVDVQRNGYNQNRGIVDADNLYIACYVGLAKVRKTIRTFALKEDTVYSGGKGSIDWADRARARRVKAEASVQIK